MPRVFKLECVQAYAGHLLNVNPLTLKLEEVYSAMSYFRFKGSVREGFVTPELTLEDDKALRGTQKLKGKSLEGLYARTFMAGFNGEPRPWFGPRVVYGIGKGIDTAIGSQLKSQIDA